MNKVRIKAASRMPKGYLRTWWQHLLASIILLAISYGLVSWAIDTAKTIAWAGGAVFVLASIAQLLEASKAILKR